MESREDLTESGKKAMDRMYRRLWRVEKRLWTAGMGDYREWKNAMDRRFRRSEGTKGYGQQAEEMTEEKRLWKAGRGDNRE